MNRLLVAGSPADAVRATMAGLGPDDRVLWSVRPGRAARVCLTGAFLHGTLACANASWRAQLWRALERLTG